MFNNIMSIRYRLLLATIVPLLLISISLISIVYVKINDLVKSQSIEVKEILIDSKKEEIRNIIELAYTTIKPLYDSGSSHEEAVKLLKTMQFGKDGYLFGYDSNSVRVFSGQSDAGIGDSYRGLIDSNGLYAINALVENGIKNGLAIGDGFVTYYFPRQGGTEGLPKLSYTMYFKNWDLMIGTGIYIDRIDTEIAEFKSNTKSVRNYLMISIMLITGVIFIVLLLIVLAIISSIIKPLNAVSLSINKLSTGDGDLTQRLPIIDKFEIGQLAENLNSFLTSLHKDMQSVVNVANEMSNETTIITQQSDQINNICDHQLSAVNAVASAATQMSASAQEVTRNANNASQVVLKAAEHGKVGLSKVADSITEMGNLIGEINHAGEVVSTVGAEAENIGAIVQVIESIAEQTNLLALNAAIEAARAGEQGRGFAVVADEVRNLASKTQGSTGEIKDMINKLQSGSRLAVESMEKSKKCASLAEISVSETSISLEDIADSVNKITEMNAQIAMASKEQNVVGEDVGKRIVEISDQSAKLNDVAAYNNQSATRNQVNVEQLNVVVAKFKLH
jgi:methyl-accepting chemotaxis protein